MNEFLKHINNIIFLKRNFLLALTVVTLVVFHIPIEHFLSNTVVQYVFSDVKSTWINDVVFGLISIATFFYVSLRFRRYNPSNNILSILIVITIIYSIYRFVYPIWTFTKFSFSSNIAYSDVLIFISILNLLLLIQGKTKKRSTGKNSFFDDEPIGKTKDDELGYTPYANLLAEKISSSHFEKAFAIGINGKWGLGKTSFIQLLKGKLQGENIIEVNFNPWNSHSPKAIIQDFFDTVQEVIRPYHSSLSRLLISYSNKLVSLNDNTITQTIQTSVTALTGFESLNSLFKDINNVLSKIDKKIIVYIDDLDRLDNEEIVEVIRLIRNNANFYNTFFIVAYDRNYVVNALKNHNQYRQEQFLEKIFQIEITLPYFKSDILRYKLAEKLKQKFPQDFHSTIDEEVIGSPSIVPVFLNEWLGNMRDVTRLANALVLNLSKLNGEVVFNDFLRLEILRLKYPAVYEQLFKKTSVFLEPFGNSGKEHHYQLKNIEKLEKESLKDTEFKNCKTNLELYLFRNYVDMSVPINEIDKIVNFINGIFEGGLSYSFYSRSHLSVIYPSKFNRYFAYNLLEGSLSEIEFSRARTLNQLDFNKKISEWVSANLEFELKNRFSEINAFDNSEDFEKVIRAIFHLANQSTLNPNFFQRNLVGYDGKDLLDKLSNYDNKLAIRYYGEQDGATKLKAFVKSLFLEAKEPYSFEADFIRHANREFSDSFPLNKEELAAIVLDYFKNYCSTKDKLDGNVWSLFHCNRKTEWVSVGGNSYQKQESMPDEVIQTMKDFVINKDLNGFLLALIDFEPFDQKKVSISNFATTLFGSWTDFKQIIEEQSENKWTYLKEFKQLLSAYEEKSYSQYVDFKFEIIPIAQRLRQ